MRNRAWAYIEIICATKHHHHHHQVPSRDLEPVSRGLCIAYSCPFCDICHALRSWPSSAYCPLQRTFQYQPVDVVTSDHVTKVGNFSFLYSLNYVNLFFYYF